MTNIRDLSQSMLMNELQVNIKERRKKLGITLKQLAEQIGVSSSYLSQVETGKVMPSMLSLKKIADTLHTTIGVLVGENKTENDAIVIRQNQRKKLNDYETSMVVQFLTNPHPDKLMEPMIMQLKEFSENDEKVKKIRYQHFGQEFVLVLKGRIQLFVGSEEYVLEEGDNAYFNCGIPHAFWNINEGISEVLSINAPPSF